MTIKSERVRAMFEDDEKFQAMREENLGIELSAEATAWLGEHPEIVMTGYVTTLISVCEERGVVLDLTYDTIKYLGMGLGALFAKQRAYHYDSGRNISIVAKTLAAYLSLVAVNEHDLRLTVQNHLSEIRAGKGPKYPLWSDMHEIGLGKKRIDLLPVCVESTHLGTIMTESGFTILIDKTAERYKQITGVDLSTLGLTNIFMS